MMLDIQIRPLTSKLGVKFGCQTFSNLDVTQLNFHDASPDAACAQQAAGAASMLLVWHTNLTSTSFTFMVLNKHSSTSGTAGIRHDCGCPTPDPSPSTDITCYAQARCQAPAPGSCGGDELRNRKMPECENLVGPRVKFVPFTVD